MHTGKAEAGTLHLALGSTFCLCSQRPVTRKFKETNGKEATKKGITRFSDVSQKNTQRISENELIVSGHGLQTCLAQPRAPLSDCGSHK